MKIVDKILRQKVLSVEIIPPKKGEDVEEIFKTLDKLLRFDISFVNITRHPVEVEYIELGDRIEKVYKMKRPGTVGLTAALLRRYGDEIEVVPHLICKGMNKFETENLLIDLWIMGVENVFVVRGEETKTPQKGDYTYSYELVEQIAKMNEGKYLYMDIPERKTNFCIGVAGYPEKHFESPNLDEDIYFLKRKIDAGAHFVITQMVFDADVYADFVKRCRKVGIDVPILPGVKPVVSLKSVYTIPKKFFVNIPQSFLERIKDARTETEEFEIGVNFTVELINGLLEKGAPGVHLFTMGRGKETCEVLKRLGKFS